MLSSCILPCVSVEKQLWIDSGSIRKSLLNWLMLLNSFGIIPEFTEIMIMNLIQEINQFRFIFGIISEQNSYRIYSESFGWAKQNRQWGSCQQLWQWRQVELGGGVSNSFSYYFGVGSQTPFYNEEEAPNSYYMLISCS